MAISSSNEACAARLSYTDASCASAPRRPLLRDALRSSSASSSLREIAPRPPFEPTRQTLPVMATAGDVRELVRLLKKRAAGITLIAAMNSEQRRIFDPRKIAAYEFWGVVSREGERIRLTALGAEIARQLEPEAHVYRTLLDAIVFYRSVLEWVFRAGLELVTHLDVAAYWQEHYPQAVAEHDEKSMEASVVCFFHLCQAAELGTATIGKRGQPARLHVERKELSEYILHAGPTQQAGTLAAKRIEQDEAPAQEATRAPGPTADHTPGPTAWAQSRLFISHAGKREMVEQIRTALELAGVESEVVERSGTGNGGDEAVARGPVAEHLLKAMRRCERAAVVLLSTEDCSTDAEGRAALKEEVLIEIGAAFVFYDARVLLVCDEGVPVPSNLQSLPVCRFAGGRLTWEEGVSLMKAIRELRG
jgi:CAP12/Pycsar effector protein, TIR domain